MRDDARRSSGYWDAFAMRRISRRRALAGALAFGGVSVVGGVSLLSSAACDDDDASSDEPLVGGTLRFGSTLAPGFGVDPHVETGGALPIIARMYGYPHHADPNTDEIVFDHVESFEQPDETTYVLRLLDGVRFQDAAPANGRALTGDDMVLSMRRYRDSAITLAKFWHTKLLIGEGATDARTVLVSLARPYVYSMAEMGAINAGAILPREVIDQQVAIQMAGSGSGPLSLESAADDAIALNRFDGYFRELALVDGMEWRYFGAASDMEMALRDGTIDLMPASSGDATRLANEIDGVTVVREPSLSSLALAFRIDRSPFTDMRVRRALDLLLDRDALIEAAGLEPGEGVPAGVINPNLAAGYWAPPAPGANADGTLDDAAARTNEARSLLDAAGAGSLSFEMQVAQVPELVDVASAIVAQFAVVGGVSVTLRPLPILNWYQNSRRGEFAATLIAHAPYETPDGAMRWYHVNGPDGNGNPMGFADGDVSSAIERSWGERDRDARRQLLLDAQEAALGHYAMLHLFTGSGFTCVRNYVRDSGLELPGSLSRYHYRQWLALPVDERPD